MYWIAHLDSVAQHLCRISSSFLVRVNTHEVISFLLVWAFGLGDIQNWLILCVSGLVPSLVAMTKYLPCHLRKEGLGLTHSWRYSCPHHGRGGTQGDWSQHCLCCQEREMRLVLSSLCTFSFFVQYKMSTFRVALPSSFKYLCELFTDTPRGMSPRWF